MCSFSATSLPVLLGQQSRVSDVAAHGWHPDATEVLVEEFGVGRGAALLPCLRRSRVVLLEHSSLAGNSQRCRSNRSVLEPLKPASGRNFARGKPSWPARTAAASSICCWKAETGSTARKCARGGPRRIPKRMAA